MFDIPLSNYHRTCGTHLRLYEYHIDSQNVDLNFHAELAVTQGRRIYGMDKSGPIFGLLFGLEGLFYVSFFDNRLITPSRDAAPLNEARFHLQGFVSAFKINHV